jgi:SAM-dependent methyltransferase
MTEKRPPHHRTPAEIEAASDIEYGGHTTDAVGTSYPAILRLLNYRTARSHNPEFDDPKWHNLHITDIHHIQLAYLYETLGVSTAASILDIGCGDGSNLLNHAMNFEHTGDLVGINLSPANYYYGEQRARTWRAEKIKKAEEEGRELVVPNIAFYPGNAMALPEFLKQGKFNVVKLDFILYHLPNPERAIDEALEAMDDNAFLVVSTRGEDNMEGMWKENLPKIGKIIDADPPSPFYADYTIERLKQDTGKRGLVQVASYSQKEPLDIGQDDLDIYAQTHAILNNHFVLHQPIDMGNGVMRSTPTYKQTMEAVNKAVIKPIKQKMDEDPNYVHRDKVHQVFYIYQKPEKLPVSQRKIKLPQGAI